jgi:diaminopimelate epimerase
MSTRLPFVKMQGAGNDFIMLAAADLPGAGLSASRIAALCDRRRGIGADGLIVVGPVAGADFRMRYYNADGGEADLCGNGARCAVAFARRLGLASGEDCAFETGAGRLKARWAEGEVAVGLPPWRDLRLAVPLPDSPFAAHHLVNTGVPHLVVPVSDPGEVDVARWGPVLRGRPELGPDGANVNWVSAAAVDGAHGLRTFERGVEGETLACGTGASAAAVVLCALDLAASPVTLATHGGDRLIVEVESLQGKRRLELRGPAAVSFTGEVACDE